jgi:MraZ protein
MDPNNFFGRAYPKLDVKGRVQVPVLHRDQLLSLSERRVVLTRGVAGCLLLYPRPQFDEIAAKMANLPSSADRVKLRVLGSAQPLEIDAAQRLLIPLSLRKLAALEGEIAWVGLGRMIQLWNPQQLHEFEENGQTPDLPDSMRDFVF